MTHRIELCKQTSNMLSEFGVVNKIIDSKANLDDHQVYSCYVAMVETLNNRLNDNKLDISDIGLVIIDEAHYNSFTKIFKFFSKSFFLGVTATPLSSNILLPMTDNYEELIVGETIETLIKNDKEEEIVIETYLPYQLIRNLNSQIAIPTFYDFRIRRYSTTELGNDFPDAKWFKKEFYISNKNVRTIDYDYDIKHLKKFFEFQQNIPRNTLLAIRKAIEILPEINLIVTDDSGYYAGQSIIFPINEATFKKLKNREITEEEITANDIVNYKTQNYFH